VIDCIPTSSEAEHALPQERLREQKFVARSYQVRSRGQFSATRPIRPPLRWRNASLRSPESAHDRERGLLPRSRSRRAPMPARHLWARSPATRSWLRCLPWTSRAAFPELCTGRRGSPSSSRP